MPATKAAHSNGFDPTEFPSLGSRLKKTQGKSEGFDSCDRPSNLTQIGFK